MSGENRHEPVGLPWWQRNTVWATLAGLVTSTAGMIAGVWTIVGSDSPKAKVIGAAIIGVGGVIGTWFGNLGSVLARNAGVGAANEIGERLGAVPPSADKEGPKP